MKDRSCCGGAANGGALYHALFHVVNGLQEQGIGFRREPVFPGFDQRGG
jgi:hypothetical protein